MNNRLPAPPRSAMVRSRFLRAAVVAALVTFVLMLQAMLDSVPRDLPDAPDDQVACLSYAPYRLAGESPFKATEVSVERIEADLKRLASRTRCVRTYSVELGLDQVPAVAGKLGMKVLLGAWIGRDEAANRAELERAIAAARRHPGVVRGLVVGNEVLLRGEQPARRLAEWLAEARQRASVPVTYADVWEFWERHDALAAQVDFVTVHILPYWEDEPVAVDAAVAHIGDIHRRMASHFGDKPILIGETGWPSAGRMRRAARPGLLEEARFHREFAIAAREQGWDYNLIEAFDQPWKRRLEGAMGGAWGLFGSDGRAKFPAHGPVAADPDAVSRLRLAVAGSVLVFVLMALARVGVPSRGTLSGPVTGEGVPGRRPTRIPPWLLLAAGQVIGLAAGLLFALQWRHLVTWARDPVEVAAIASIIVCSLLLALATIPGIGIAVSERSARTAVAGWAARLREPAAAFVLFGLAIVALLLAFDPRYRSFPVALYGAPLLMLTIRHLAVGPAVTARPEQVVLGVMVVAGVGLNLVQEGVLNREAWQFAAVAAGLVYVLVIAPCRAADRRLKAIAPSTSPTAAGLNE